MGAAILGLRLLLLCGRVASTQSDYDYSYNPSTFPTYDPALYGNLFADASAFIPTPPADPAAQPIAVASDGTAYWWSLGSLESQPLDSKPAGVDVSLEQDDLEPSLDNELLVGDKTLYWLTSHFEHGEIVSAPRAGGSAKIVAKDLANAGSPVLDGGNIFVTVAGEKEDTRSLVRIPSGGGAPVRLGSWSDSSSFVIDDLALDATNAYVVADGEDDTSSYQVIRRMPKSGGPARDLIKTLPGEHVDKLATSGKYVYFTTNSSAFVRSTAVHRVLASGGEREDVYEAPDGGAIGDLVTVGGEAFVARRADGGWAIRRIAASSSATPLGDVVVGLKREPHFAVAKDRIVYSSGYSVESRSKSQAPAQSEKTP